MRRVPPIGLFVLLMAGTGLAQSTIGPGDIRCRDCAVSGQTAATAPIDVSQVEFVANPVPAFDENRTIRMNVIARVLQPAPLLLDVLDARVQTVDRNMRVLQEPSRAPDVLSGCVLVDPHQPIDLASKPVVLALHMNDIVTANVILNRDPRMPDAILAATPTLTDVRKAAAPVSLFHTGNVKAECANRSGRLIEYLGPEDGDLTIVYNDGGIYYRNAAYLTFTREKLSPAELSDLLRAFRDVNFDALPTTFPQKQSANRPGLALMAARYQRVALSGGDARLAPLMKRIDALADRATSHARYIVKADRGVPIVVRKREHRRSDPSLTAMSGRLWPQSMGIRLRDVPPAGLTIGTDEFTQHKAIYFPILRGAPTNRTLEVAGPFHSG